MSEPDQRVVASPAGQPETPPVQPDQTQDAPQLEGLSREEVLKMVKEAEETAFRRAQGLITKTNTRIRERVGEIEQVLGKAGVTLDASQKAALVEQVTNQVSTEEPSEPASLEPPPPADPITQIASQMMKEAGVVVYEDDPEAKLIDMSNPYKFITSLPKAIEAKKARENTSSKTTNTPGMAGGGTPPSPYAGKSGVQLISSHFEKKGL